MQAIESAGLSLAEFRLRSGFDAGVETRKESKLPMALATVLWAFSLAARTGIQTPYGLERRFEPRSFGVNEHGDPFHSNKWRHYFSGRHEPRKVLAAVERDFPGANSCLRSPLWRALEQKPLTKADIEALFLKLSPRIHEVVRRRGLRPRQHKLVHLTIDQGLAQVLERHASLEALAAEILLLRFAHVEGHQRAAFAWGRRVLRMMVLLGPDLLAGGVAQPLCELVQDRVVQFATLDGFWHGFVEGRYLKLVSEFTLALYRIEGHPAESMTARNRNEFGQRILQRHYGYDYFHAFNPIVIGQPAVPGTRRSAPAQDQAAQADRDRWLHQWAMNMLSRGGHRGPPPTDVWNGTNLWAFDPDDRYVARWCL